MSADLGELYASSRRRLTELLQDAPSDVAERSCPATPGWRVRDVVAHVRGIAEDVRTGNLDGVATDPWTAAQVARHRDVPLATLLADWAVDAVPFEEFLSGPYGEGAARAVVDLHTHEFDVRAALGPAGPLSATFAGWAIPQLASGFIERVAEAGLPSVRLTTDEGDAFGDAVAAVTVRASRFELFRAILGRRCASQVIAYDWAGADPTPYLPHLAVFPARSDPLME